MIETDVAVPVADLVTAEPDLGPVVGGRPDESRRLNLRLVPRLTRSGSATPRPGPGPAREGKAAKETGLKGHVLPGEFEDVLDGWVPGTEIRLGRMREGEHDHRPG